MDSFDGAREDRGYGIPLTDEERQARHFDRYGTQTLPPRGTGLQSIGVIQSIGDTAGIKSDVIGLLAGGFVGWYVSKRWPNMVVKYVGIVVGAELGIIISRLIGNKDE